MTNATQFIVFVVAVLVIRAIRSTYVSKKERTGLRLKDPSYWYVSEVMDASIWLRSLPLLEPTGAVLYLEGVHDDAVKSFLIPRVTEEYTPVGPLTIWPRQGYFHMPATVENLEELAELIAAQPVERLAIHACLYKEQLLLLEWYESFCPPDEQGVIVTDEGVDEVHQSPMMVSLEVPEERVRAFARAISAAFWLSKPRVSEQSSA